LIFYFSGLAHFKRSKKMKFFAYILISELDNSLYIGQTENIEKRLQRHNAGKNKYTSRKRPWKLLHAEPCTTRAEAMKLEKYLKSLKKRKAVFDWINKNSQGVAQPGADFVET